MSCTVHRLHLAEVTLSGKYNPPDFHDTRLDVFGYLILTSENIILVDTGVGSGNDFIEKTFEPKRKSIIEELSRYEVQPENVSMVVNSHLHFDHCGNNSLFPHATFFIQKSELEIARSTAYTINE